MGEEEKSFVVHKAVICSASPFFEKATSSEWTEAKAQVVKLPATELDIFHAYTHWIYAANVDMSIIPEPSEETTGARVSPPSYLNLAKLWILSDML